MTTVAAIIADHVRRWRRAGEPLIVGLCGPQGSGKSTAAGRVADALAADGLRVAVLSLDDLYLGRAARAVLAAQTHPLFVTRGPPGTHDVALGRNVLRALKLGHDVVLPRFDKARDAPFPESDWPHILERCDVILFEGWCVGARPQDEEALAQSINALERDEDADGIWRRTANKNLAEMSAQLFALVDRLVYLSAPDFDVVHAWRCEQEHGLIANAGEAGAPAAMTDVQIARFIAHFERISRHIAVEMPARVDLRIDLDQTRNVVAVMG